MMIILGILAVVSLFANVILVWYVRKLISQLYFFLEEVSNLQDEMGSFDTHLKSIYELEMFYGDDTLEGLLEHSRNLLYQMVMFKNSFSLEQDEEEEDA